MTYNIAVVGATGNVGRELLKILSERQFPINSIHALASKRSVGRQVSFGEDKVLTVDDLNGFDFSNIDFVLSSAGAKISADFAPKAAAQGAIVIDNTSHFRMDEDKLLIVPEVNGDLLHKPLPSNIIANPNCSTIQLVVALKPLHEHNPIRKVVVSCYQSVSGAGKAGMDELYDQSRKIFVSEECKPKAFSKRIAFNVIPQIDVPMDNGAFKEEWKMMHETKKILDPNISLHATCVRVPVFICHSEAVHLQFSNSIEANTAKQLLADAPSIVLMEEDDSFHTPIDAVGEDGVYVSRVRNHPEDDTCLDLWVVSDNLRKGAALNAVQIAEELVKAKHK